MNLNVLLLNENQRLTQWHIIFEQTSDKCAYYFFKKINKQVYFWIKMKTFNKNYSKTRNRIVRIVEGFYQILRIVEGFHPILRMFEGLYSIIQLFEGLQAQSFKVKGLYL